MPPNSNFHLITGNDEAAIPQVARKVIASLVGEKPDPWVLDVIREAEGRTTANVFNDLINALQSPSFLGQTKTIWLQNFSNFAAESAAKSKSGDAGAFVRLGETIAAGIPPGINLVMSGPNLSPDKKLYKACLAASATVREFWLPDPKDRDWHSKMARIVQERGADKGLSIPPAIANHIVQALGTDTLLLDMELEKLACYLNGNPITMAAVEEMVRGPGDADFWGLGDIILKRNFDESMRHAHTLLAREKDPDRVILSFIANLYTKFRPLLQLRVFMYEHKIKTDAQLKTLFLGMSHEERTKALDRGFACVSLNPNSLRYRVADALRFSGQELVQIIRLLRDANYKCVSGGEPRLVFENLIRAIAIPEKRSSA